MDRWGDNPEIVNHLEISVADPEDYPAIWELQRLAYATESLLYDDLIPPMRQAKAEAIVDCSQSRVFKACLDGRLVGSVRGRSADGTCLIGRLMVLPECRRKGIGTALLQAVEQDFSARRYELFTGTKSLANIRLYQHLGYTVFRTDPEQELVYLEKIRASDRYNANITPIIE